ncbi:DMT family transporter [Cumulibacter manganitolerans]|uniref:DMT family transporter n=1 Tax=Cumulibacter manganitolerans TaxID=1884992 RepID=UPI001294DC22|nr:multidrug efflux SMR transporter [Cumulibacter manganitolerans]
MNPWLALLIAGAFEVGFTTCLKLGQRHKAWIWGFVGCAIVSFGLLSVALQEIPVGTAYAVWTGIGAVGTVLVGGLAFKERLSARVVLIVAVVVALIVGLKLTGE